ncbi:hypothetical protein K439DRAFT_142918 [Ramaria rubella]|nr:hypothetical protein K439DRAFT_142918 [Ramaria rubella]
MPLSFLMEQPNSAWFGHRDRTRARLISNIVRHACRISEARPLHPYSLRRFEPRERGWRIRKSPEWTCFLFNACLDSTVIGSYID